MNAIKNLLPWLKFSWPVLSAVPYVKFEAFLLLWLGASNVILLRVAFCAIVLIFIELIVVFFIGAKIIPD